MKLSVKLITLLSLVVSVWSSNYFFGNHPRDSKPMHREKLTYYAVPWRKRVITYTYNETSHPIQAIDCFDYQRTEATVNITDGGVGFTHVTMLLKSQRSYGLEYAIEIYGGE